MNNPREGWDEAFKQMHENGDDELLFPDNPLTKREYIAAMMLQALVSKGFDKMESDNTHVLRLAALIPAIKATIIADALIQVLNRMPNDPFASEKENDE
jgi:hypothetical protein